MTNDYQIDEYGHGIICPFQRDGKGDFANSNGLKLLKSDITELIGIIGPTVQQPGELPWNTDIGSRVLTMKHRTVNAEIDNATAGQMVEAAVRAWEPRARAGQTELVTDLVAQKITIKFSYIPKGRYSSGNQETVNFVVPQI